MGWKQQLSESRRDEEEGGELDFKKKLDTFAGPGEIKRREEVLDHQVSPEEIKSRELELGSAQKVGLPFCFLLNSGATDIVLVILPSTAVETAIV